MSVLRKKLQAKKGMPAAYKTLPEYFISIYEQIAAYLESALSREIALEPILRGPIFSHGDNFDAYKKEMTGLLFALGENEEQNEQAECEVIIEVSAHLAQTIISAKLGGAAEQDTKQDEKFTLFDVLVIQPLAELGLQQLQSISGAAAPEIISDRSLTMDGFKSAKFAKQEKWMKLDFPITMKVDKKEGEKTTKKKKPNAKNDDGLSLTLYITRRIAENIARIGQEQQSCKIIDPESPWSRHMRGTMLAAARPLEIVVEDLKLSIAECTRLELGQIIALPGASHERLNIKTASSNGKIILTTATLGAFKSSKAVKLNQDIDPVFLGDLPFCE